MKNKTALIVAVVLGLIAVFAIQSYVSRVKRAAYKGTELVKVVVAKEDITRGTIIKKEIIASRGIPGKFVDSRAVLTREYENIIGQPIRYTIKKGQPILWSDLGGGRVKGLASIIGGGERAITIAVDDITGVSGLLQPNDHVDILGTFGVKVPGQEGARGGTEMTTITLLQDVTVLAAGEEMTGSMARSAKRFGVSGGYSSLTLSVTPVEAELLVFAEQQGKLSLALRNPEDIGIKENIPKITFDYIGRLTEIRQLMKERKKRIEVIRGKQKTME